MTSKNKWLITNYYAEMGGGEFALFKHAEWLLSNKIDLCVCLFKDGPLVNRLKSLGVNVQIINQKMRCGPKMAKIIGIKVVPKLIWILRSFKPDVVISYTHHELPFMINAVRRFGIPLIYRDQATIGTDVKNVDWREKNCPYWLKKDLTAIICTTQVKAKDLIAKGAPPEKVYFNYLGIDKSAFGSISDDEIIDTRLELNFPVENKLIGIFGRLIKWKGQDVFIKALAQIERKDVYGLVVGGPQLNQESGKNYEAELRQLAINEGVGERVIFTGFREDVPVLMKACDIVCHTSYQEPFGLVIVEAMMAGKPVIASDVTGPREIVLENETGFLTTPGRVDELVMRLNQLLSDSQLSSKFSGKGFERARQCFDLESNLNELNTLVCSLIYKR